MPSLSFPPTRLLARILHLPKGSEGILLIGLIGGYPVGAQAITDAWKRKILNTQQAQIVLGFCSNAGPAFIFGITRILFSSHWIPWILWTIHIVSALIVGSVLPRIETAEIVFIPKEPISISQAMKQSISIIACVCGWIVGFKTLLYMVAPFIPNMLYLTTLSGLLELSSGCLQLSQIASQQMRMILCTMFLAFGGICVLLQTSSVTEKLGLGYYLPGKIMQMIVSLWLCIPISGLLYHDVTLLTYKVFAFYGISGLVLMGLIKHCRKSCGNLSNLEV